MDLLHKVRVLVGALAHQPLGQRRHERNREEGSGASPQEGSPGAGPDLEAAAPGIEDTDRVADLIARQKASRSG